MLALGNQLSSSGRRRSGWKRRFSGRKLRVCVCVCVCRRGGGSVSASSWLATVVAGLSVRMVASFGVGVVGVGIREVGFSAVMAGSGVVVASASR